MQYLPFSACRTKVRWTLILLSLTALGGCGGGGGGDEGGAVDDGVDNTPPPTLSGTVSVDDILSGSAKLATADPSAPFTQLPAGVTPVSVNSPPVVNFVVKTSDGRVVSGLTTEHIRVALAKLVPGTLANPNLPGSGESDEWVSYIYREKIGDLFPDGVWQATTETPASLVYNESGGYYTYTFSTDVTSATLPDTDTLIWDPTATHRVGIQLQIRDADRNTVAVANPYFDFTFDAAGDAVAVDPSQTHLVADKSYCNQCHDKLAMHGGGRVDPQYCVLCHNPGTTDVVTGNVLDFKVMIHKIHAGRSLTIPYAIGNYRDIPVDFSDVGFPQDLRNCSKCHHVSDAEPLTPQGDNWKTKATQQACGACHDDPEKVDFNDHQGFDFIADDGTPDNSACARCHSGELSEVSVEYVHWNQLEAHSKNYRFNIEAVAYDAATRQVSVDYSLTNPNDGTAYDLTEGCDGDCTRDNRFGNLRLYVASLTLIGASESIADYTDTVNDSAYKGTDDGTHHYRLTLPALPEDSAEQAHGTARVVSIGQVKEPKIDNIFTGEIVAETFVNVPVVNTYQEFALDGDLQSRRLVVSDAKCNSCHGMLGTASGSNTLENAFHSGARNSVASCPICHNANRASTTLMTDPNGDVLPYFPETTLFAGRTFNQSYEFKNMIHGIHGGEQRSAPFTHGNPPDEVIDYSEEVAYPGILADCTACHEGDSYLTDRSPLGSSVLSTSTRTSNLNADLLVYVTNSDGLIDPLLLPVFSPKAASCVGCHDTAANREHMRDVGGAAFDLNQAAVALDGKVFERCDECHGASGAEDVKSVHGIE